MKEYSGFFELELPKRKPYHKEGALKLNTARHCILYVVLAKKYKKIYLPYYICDTVENLLNKYNIETEYYFLNDNFYPVFDKKINIDEGFLYPNYFGLHDKNVERVIQNFENTIIDNTQAFYHIPANKSDVCYSARKFFGVSDGAYLYTDKFLDKDLEQDISYERFSYLLARIEKGANFAYPLSLEVENEFCESKIKLMSNLTSRILESLDYKEIKKKRIQNFKIMASKLSKINELNLDLGHCTPMIYPLLIKSDSLREKLISNKIYVPQWWKTVVEKTPETSNENYWSRYLIPLPIDQRYDKSDMLYITDLIVNK